MVDPTAARQPSLKAMPRTRPYASATGRGSRIGEPERASRTAPPTGCRKAARAARAASPHSAPTGSCSIRNGGSSGPSSGGKAVVQRTTSPSARVRDPATGWPIGDPSSLSAATSSTMESVASAYVTSPSSPDSSRSSAARPTANPAAAAACDRSKTPMSSRNVSPRNASRLYVPRPSCRPPPVNTSPRSPFQLGRSGLDGPDGDDEVVDPEEHPRIVVGRGSARAGPTYDGPMSLPVPPDHLPFTGDPEADRLIADGPARPADRLRARPAGDGPEGVLGPARAAAPR